MESPGKPQGPTPTRCLVESHSSRMADPLCTVQKLCFHCNHVSLLANTQIHTKIYNIILLFGYIFICIQSIWGNKQKLQFGYVSVWFCVCVSDKSYLRLLQKAGPTLSDLFFHSLTSFSKATLGCLFYVFICAFRWVGWTHLVSHPILFFLMGSLTSFSYRACALIQVQMCTHNE